jgi:PTS system fructose-specific IIC component
MSALITTDLVALDADLGPDKDSVIRRLAGLVAGAGRATGTEALHDDAMAREAKVATGLPGGIAIPHCRSGAVTEASLAFARLDPKVDFGAPDGPADLVFLIAAPEHGDADHLTLLTALARALVRPEFVASLRAAGSAEEVVGLVQDVVSPQPVGATTGATAAAVPAGDAPAAAAPSGRSIVAISACPTGIAHTYMAADKLTAAAKEMGVDLQVETQGSSGSTPLDPGVISRAAAVIFAVDVGVRDRDRFAGKPLVQSGTKRAMNEPEVMIREALAAADDPDARRVPGAAGDSGRASDSGDRPGTGSEVRRWLLTGVSYMIPFVAAGGLLIALGFLLGGYRIVTGNPASTSGQSYALSWALDNNFFNLPGGAEGEGLHDGLRGYLGALCTVLGQAAFGFLVPALAGYIAYAIADRPGIVPGFVVGAVSVTMGAGFLGGVVGGIIAGFAARWIAGWALPAFARGLQPVVIIPLLATLISSGLMVALLGQPLAAALTGLGNFLTGLTGGSIVLLGVILGLMMCFDLGGPVNKAAYVFATTGIGVAEPSPANLQIMAMVMGAGMVPPLAMALSTLVRSKLYSAAERDNGKAAWLLGLAFISEGAIPFAAADPLRVIPSMMLGGATTGALVGAFGTELRAPHGGVFVFFAMTQAALFLVAVLIGAVVGGLAVTVAKSIGRRPGTPGAASEEAMAGTTAPARTAGAAARTAS